MEGVWQKRERRHLFIGHLTSSRVGIGVKLALHRQAGFGPGRRDQFQDHRVALARLAAPVLADPGNGWGSRSHAPPLAAPADAIRAQHSCASPTSSFFFASTDTAGSPAAKNALAWALTWANWASRSGCSPPSRVLRLACKR